MTLRDLERIADALSDLTLFPVSDDAAEVRELLDAGKRVKLDGEAIGCRNRDLRLWFPEGKPDDTDPIWRTPRAICSGCPERIPCLAYAIQTASHTAGMYGGLTPNERKHLRREMRKR